MIDLAELIQEFSESTPDNASVAIGLGKGHLQPLMLEFGICLECGCRSRGAVEFDMDDMQAAERLNVLQEACRAAWLKMLEALASSHVTAPHSKMH